MAYKERVINPNENVGRRDQVELILDILEAVPVDTIASIENISRASGARWATTKKYVELIVKIQNSPKVRIYDMSGSTRKAYKREPGRVVREL